MELEHCYFPDDLLYDQENNTWLRITEKGEVIVGVTSLLSSIAGKMTSVRVKAMGTKVNRRQSLGTLESLKFVGPIPSPVSGTVSGTNDSVMTRPKLLNDYPYDDGWIARLQPTNLHEEAKGLAKVGDVEGLLRRRIAQLRARCFKAFPDQEMIEIGTECSAVLVHLNELLSSAPIGEIVHLVTDDPTSYVEMERWKDQRGQGIVDWRQEGNLFHFIVRKEH